MSLPIRRLMSSLSQKAQTHAGIVSIILTDPAYIKNASEYDENITPDQAGTECLKTPGNYVRLPMAKSLFDSLVQPKQQFLCPSPEGDEMFLSLGPLGPLSSYSYLGCHHSDSGLTCIVREGIYEVEGTNVDGEPMEEMDWLELVAGSLEATREGTVNVEDFPMLQFCASVPEDESAIAVFGRKIPSSNADSTAETREEGYNSLVLRAWCKVFRGPDDEPLPLTRTETV